MDKLEMVAETIQEAMRNPYENRQHEEFTILVPEKSTSAFVVPC